MGCAFIERKRTWICCQPFLSRFKRDNRTVFVAPSIKTGVCKGGRELAHQRGCDIDCEVIVGWRKGVLPLVRVADQGAKLEHGCVRAQVVVEPDRATSLQIDLRRLAAGKVDVLEGGLGWVVDWIVGRAWELRPVNAWTWNIIARASEPSRRQIRTGVQRSVVRAGVARCSAFARVRDGGDIMDVGMGEDVVTAEKEIGDLIVRPAQAVVERDAATTNVVLELLAVVLEVGEEAVNEQ